MKEYSTEFKIKTALNGLVCEIKSWDGETETIVSEECDGNEVQSFADFLRILLDHYGPSTSRYSPERIQVRIVPGDKYDGPDKEADEALAFYLRMTENPTIEDAFLAGRHSVL